MTLTSLSVHELNEAAQAATQGLVPVQEQTPITAHTPYMTFTEFRYFLRLYGIEISIIVFRKWLSCPSKSLIIQLQSILASDVPQRWCRSISNQQSRSGIVHIIPLPHLSETSQLLAKKNQFGRSFVERLSPDEKVIFQLLIQHSTVSYATAAKHCRGHLPRSTFFHIKKRLFSQERNFPWKPSSSRSVSSSSIQNTPEPSLRCLGKSTNS